MFVLYISFTIYILNSIRMIIWDNTTLTFFAGEDDKITTITESTPLLQRKHLHYFCYKNMRSVDYVYANFDQNGNPGWSSILLSKSLIKDLITKKKSFLEWFKIYFWSLLQATFDIVTTVIIGFLTPIFMLIYFLIFAISIFVNCCYCCLCICGICSESIDSFNNTWIQNSAIRLRKFIGWTILDVILSYFYAPVYLVCCILQIISPYIMLYVLEYDTWYPIRQNIGFSVQQNNDNKIVSVAELENGTF